MLAMGCEDKPAPKPNAQANSNPPAAGKKLVGRRSELIQRAGTAPPATEIARQRREIRIAQLGADLAAAEPLTLVAVGVAVRAVVEHHVEHHGELAALLDHLGAHEGLAHRQQLDAHGCAVSANTFVLLKLPPKTKDGTQPPQLDTLNLRIAKDSSRITVTGNSFCDSYIGAGAVKRKVNDQLASGIALEGTREVNITGNTFSSLPKSVELRRPDSENLIFSNNLMIDAPSDLAP